MEQKVLDRFCFGVRFANERNDEKNKRWKGNIKAAIFFEPVMCLLIGVVEKPDEVKETKRLITERLHLFQKEFGKIWEFDVIDNLPSDDQVPDILFKGVEKPIICIVDEITYKNWREAGRERHIFLIQSNHEFLLDRSFITYLYEDEARRMANAGYS